MADSSKNAESPQGNEETFDVDPAGTETQSSSASNSQTLKDDVTEDECDNSQKPDSKLELPRIITVKCGPLIAKMHVERFVCPGIHQPCIELDGEPGFITPKAFTVRANKDKQKDWKGSIRIGKSNLRTLMENRTFDFHDHANFCSAKCQSRNYITPKDREVGSDSQVRRHSLGKLQSYTPSFGDSKEPTLGSLFKNPSFSYTNFSHALKNNNNVPRINSISTQPVMHSIPPPTEELIDVDDTLCTSSSLNPTSLRQQNVEQLTTLMTTDPTVFWNEMVRCGAAEPIVDQMIETLNGMREKMRCGETSHVAPFLSRAISTLGICDKVVSLLRRRNSLSMNAKHRLSTDYSSMEDNLIRKRSIDDTVYMPDAPTIKRPCAQYPISILPMLAPKIAGFPEQKLGDPTVFQNLQNSQTPTEALLSMASRMGPTQFTAASLLSCLGDTLLTINH